MLPGYGNDVESPISGGLHVSTGLENISHFCLCFKTVFLNQKHKKYERKKNFFSSFASKRAKDFADANRRCDVPE